MNLSLIYPTISLPIITISMVVTQTQIEKGMGETARRLASPFIYHIVFYYFLHTPNCLYCKCNHLYL